ncbi:hypothetical protein OAO87_02685 [bacterium]|nr:hypothetical protein [bacterium]
MSALAFVQFITAAPVRPIIDAVLEAPRVTAMTGCPDGLTDGDYTIPEGTLTLADVRARTPSPPRQHAPATASHGVGDGRGHMAASMTPTRAEKKPDACDHTLC